MSRQVNKTKLAAGVLGAMFALSASASAGVIASESFDSYSGTITTETSPANGSPFADFSLVSIVREGSIEVRDNNLDGTDNGRHLALSAIGQAGETVASRISRSMIGGKLDLDALSAFVNDDGLIGKDGTTLFLSFKMRAAGVYAGDPQFEAGLQIVDPANLNSENFMVGKHWASGRETNYHLATTAGVLGPLDTPGEEQVHTFLVKFEFKNGDDTISAWFNPTVDSEATPTVTIDFDLPGFDSIRLRTSQNLEGNSALVEFDDLIIGTTFEAVVPEPAAMSLLIPGALLWMRRRR